MILYYSTKEIYIQLNALKAECDLPEVAENYVQLSELLTQIEDLEVTVECKENEWLELSEWKHKQTVNYYVNLLIL